MGPTAARVACAWLLAASLLCSANARDDGVLGPDGQDETPQLTRKLLAQNGGELGCPCAHEAHVAGECPCHLDTTWWYNDECPSCPVYACGECDPLKCDECKRCCDGAVLSEDRKTCSCPACDIAKCLECDAEDCSNCLVCEHGYKLGADRKCEVAECLVPYCQTCQLEDRYKCDRCNPYTVKSKDERSCNCPECAVSGCEVCNPEKCDECSVCAGNVVPLEGKCGICSCTIPHCDDCTDDCSACRICTYGYELFEYNTKCKAMGCYVDHCKECDPMDADQCWQCEEHYNLKDEEPPTPDECHCGHDSCQVPNCAVCSDNNCSSICYECDVDFKLTPNGTCEVERCYVPGCKSCPYDPYCCTECKDGHKLVDGKCVCDPCDIPYCDVCQPDSCSDVCEKCKPPYVIGYASDSCVCDYNSCDIAHCDECNREENCGTCYRCEEGYVWNSTLGLCECEMTKVEHCHKHNADNCNICDECDPPLVPSKDGTQCICDTSSCGVDYCDTPNPDDDCKTCAVCHPPLYPSGYPIGSTCECQYCDIEGCSRCAAPDCTTCDEYHCEPPSVLGKDGSCVCDPSYCNIDGCQKCDPSKDCSKCEVCEDPEKEPNEEGQCVCKEFEIPNCIKHSQTECGTCEECKVFYGPSYDKKSCECNVKYITGCDEEDTEYGKCECKTCNKRLVKVGGFCFFKESLPGCDWTFKVSGSGSCADVCAKVGKDNYRDPIYGPDYKEENGLCFGQFASTDPEGMRPGYVMLDRTVVPPRWDCKVEKNTGQGEWEYWGDKKGIKHGTCNAETTPAFVCPCKKEDAQMYWYPGPQTYFGRRYLQDQCPGRHGGCSAVCGDKNLQAVSLPGGYNTGVRVGKGWDPKVNIGGKKDSRTQSVPYAACRVGDEPGYQVDENYWCGYCLTPTKSSKVYECLCGLGSVLDDYGNVHCPGDHYGQGLESGSVGVMNT